MKIVFIRHQKDFSSTEELIELASGSEEDAATLSFAHVQITTTEVYLRALDVATDEVRDALGFLYGATL